MQKDEPIPSDSYDAVVRTAALVRLPAPALGRVHRALRHRSLRRQAGLAMLLLGLSAAASAGAPRPSGHIQLTTAAGDSELFSLTNGDRASNGVGALVSNPTLAGIGETHPYSICHRTAQGRAFDMLNYGGGYFDHHIPPCGDYVFVMMQEANLRYASAGENIGWEAYAGDPAGYINQQFMNSPEHRSNILDNRYTDLGIGSASSSSWMGQSQVTMFAEEFLQSVGSAPPAPPTPLPPAPPRNTPAPVHTPSVTAVSTQAPTPPPTAAPNPTATPPPPPTPSPQIIPPPIIWQGSGLLSDSVETVLESYLIN